MCMITTCPTIEFTLGPWGMNLHYNPCNSTPSHCSVATKVSPQTKYTKRATDQQERRRHQHASQPRTSCNDSVWMQELIGLNPLIRKQTTNKQQDVYILLIGAGHN